MGVEKRYSKRQPFSIDTYIRYRKQRVFPARAENCSRNGMCLRIENLTLLTGALVELDFHYKDRHWQIAGVVTYSEKNGLGVMFWHPQHDLYAAVVADNATLSRNQEIPDILNTKDAYTGDAAQ